MGYVGVTFVLFRDLDVQIHIVRTVFKCNIFSFHYILHCMYKDNRKSTCNAKWAQTFVHHRIFIFLAEIGYENCNSTINMLRNIIASSLIFTSTSCFLHPGFEQPSSCKSLARNHESDNCAINPSLIASMSVLGYLSDHHVFHPPIIINNILFQLHLKRAACTPGPQQFLPHVSF